MRAWTVSRLLFQSLLHGSCSFWRQLSWDLSRDALLRQPPRHFSLRICNVDIPVGRRPVGKPPFLGEDIWNLRAAGDTNFTNSHEFQLPLADRRPGGAQFFPRKRPSTGA